MVRNILKELCYETALLIRVSYTKDGGILKDRRIVVYKHIGCKLEESSRLSTDITGGQIQNTSTILHSYENMGLIDDIIITSDKKRYIITGIEVDEILNYKLSHYNLRPA